MDRLTVQNQEIQSHALENMLVSSNGVQERKPRPQQEQALKCPRCDSTNTKFCYYNNYSLSQPRYFCKSCRRYWTKGGTLRNVPVGGGCRKNKRSSSSSSSAKFRIQAQPLSLSGFPPLFSGQCFDEHDIAAFGNSSTSHCDLVAGNHGFSDASVMNYNCWSDLGNNYSGHSMVENGGREFAGGNEEMGLTNHELIHPSSTTGVTVTRTEQEVCNGGNRGMWGFPWQMNGEENMADLNSGRESWSGNMMAPAWQLGLLNAFLT